MEQLFNINLKKISSSKDEKPIDKKISIYF